MEVLKKFETFSGKFCFQLAEDEYADLRVADWTTSYKENASLKEEDTRYLPYVFTGAGEY